MIELTNKEIDPQQLLSSVQSPLAGAVVLFLGTTRKLTEDQETASLDYECHESMALKQLAALRDQAQQRWPLTACAIVHRLGHLRIGEASIAVAVSSPHRAASFEAASWLMDEIKEHVPIWKRENWADGTSEWVHPGLDAAEIDAAEDRK